jgi:EAL and modified HD-GYP domain-containing signal transduction protein
MTTPTASAISDPVRESFIVRHPVFDADRQVIGYELLCRSVATSGPGADEATTSARLLSDALSVFGLNDLTGGGKAFIPLARQALVDGYATLLPREHVVVELPGRTELDAELLQACSQLKKDGYTLALDGFQNDPALEPLVGMADILKVDLRATPPEQCRLYAELFVPRGKVLLAQGVGTWQEQQDALAWGYRYLQGFFFCKPEVLSGKDLPPSRVTVVRLLAKLCWSAVDFASVEQIIKQDPPLSLKLVAYLNSALFARRHEISSIRQAVIMLGLKNLQRWVSLFATATLAEGRPFELFRTCLVRARFCELLAAQADLRQQELDLFLAGLLSALDALLGRPLEELLEQLAIAENVRTALAGGPEPLGQVYAVARAYERGDWETVNQKAGDLGMTSGTVVEAYLQALQWADDTSGQVHRASRSPAGRAGLRSGVLATGKTLSKKAAGSEIAPPGNSGETSAR